MKSIRRDCPACGSTSIVLYTSFNRKQCGNCHRYFDWPLSAEQRPIFAGHRDKRKVKNVADRKTD